MSALIIEVDGDSVMEQNVRAIGVAYDALTLATKVVDEGGARPVWAFGRAALNNNIGPPSVTWVPMTGTIEAPLNVGGGLEDGGTAVKGRSLVDRLLNFEVFCNGGSYEETENLVVSVIAATRAAMQVGTSFTEEAWMTERPDVADTALNEVVAVIGVAIRMPVLDQSGGLTVIATQTHTDILDPDLVC